jgi:hypothetical protein
VRDELFVVCTDRQQHASVQIARFHWVPSQDASGVAIWDPTDEIQFELMMDELETLHPEATQSNTRQTKAGKNRVTERRPSVTLERADGGTTYQFPPCPRCRRRFWLRDDKLSSMRRAGVLAADLSLVL